MPELVLLISLLECVSNNSDERLGMILPVGLTTAVGEDAIKGDVTTPVTRKILSDDTGMLKAWLNGMVSNSELVDTEASKALPEPPYVNTREVEAVFEIPASTGNDCASVFELPPKVLLASANLVAMDALADAETKR